MPDKPTKLQRWLDVVSYLANRRFPVSTEDLWRGVPAYARGVDGSKEQKQAVRRTFERDKDELRAAGIPIETVTYSINYGGEQQVGYRLARRDFHLPYLELLREAEHGDARKGRPSKGAPGVPTFELNEYEAGAALDGLRELASIPGFPLASAARSAFRKLAFDLDPETISEAPVHYAPDPEAVGTAGLVRDLSGAVQRRKAITFRYRAISTDTEEERRAHPHGLLFQHGRWYLVAHDTDREAMRMYRVGRMSGLSVNDRAPGTPDYDVPADFSLEAYAGRRAWELGGGEGAPVEAVVRFRFPRSLWAERNRHGTLVEEAEDGSQRRSFEVHRADPFLRWVLSLAGDATIEAPEALRADFLGLAARVADLHTGSDADD